MLGVYLLMFTRLSAFVAACPVFAVRAFPPPARIGLAAALAAALLPLVNVDHMALPDHVVGYAFQVVQEAFVGLGLGALTGLAFNAVRTAGQLAGLQIGYAIAEMFDPVSGEQNAVLAQFFYLLGLVFFFSIDGHHLLVAALAKSFQHIPPGTAVLKLSVAEVGARAFQGLFVTALRLAGPVIAVALVTDLALGLMVRMVPQINAFMLGFPLKIAAGLIALAVTVPLLGGVLARVFEGMARDMLVVARGLGG
ncbi:MAG: flagellar biosynthetic protein FliR [Bacillota bacterium]